MITFSKATNRKTECYWVSVGDLQVTISYETIIAASYGRQRLRLKNIWGPTTGRHFNETGTNEYDVVAPQELARFIESSLQEAALKSLTERLSGATSPYEKLPQII